MEDLTNDTYWPLVPGALRLKVLTSVLPLSFGQLAEAFSYELISLDSLREVLSHPRTTVEKPSDMLCTFLRTASIFDRKRDVQEELERLAASEEPVRPPLWKLLATLIVRREVGAPVKLYVLEDLFQKFGQPAELRPYTLYGDMGGKPSGAQSLVDELSALLDQEFPQRT